MRVGRTWMGVMLAMSWGLSAAVWAGTEDAGAATAARPYQSVTEELMAMIKETMGIIKNLDHAPTAAEKRQLTKMMGRLDVMLKQQQDAMENMRQQLDSIRQQQDEFFRRQHIIEQQQFLPQH